MMRLLEQLMEYRFNPPPNEKKSEPKPQANEQKPAHYKLKKEDERRIKKMKANMNMGSAGETGENFSASSEGQASINSSLLRRYRN